MHEAIEYDPTWHDPRTKAAKGECSQHGVESCKEAPVISFRDEHNRRQSGCRRAEAELKARGVIR